MTKTNEKPVMLITGGSSGLGKALAQHFIKTHDVVIVSNDQLTLGEAAKEIGCEAIFCDITNYEQVYSVVNEILEKHEKIDILINNAGVWASGLLEDTAPEKIKLIMDVNALGTMYVTHAVVPSMKKQKSGKILNINSVDGLTSKVERSAYVASKWAITGFTQCMQKELKEFNVDVMGFYPSLMKTCLFKNAGGERDMSEAMCLEDAVRAVEFMLSYGDGIIPEHLVLRNIDY